MAFKDIAGNSHVKKVLRIALKKKRIPNSLLFSGPDGVGKRDMAVALAKAMNCLKKGDDACESCTVCRAIQGRRFPDVLEIESSGDVIKIEQMREVKQLAYLMPMVGKKRIFIVDDAEKMSEEAANSLLKILEEPPLFSHIILITQNPFLMLETIKSRCQVLNFSRISRGEIERILIERGDPEEKAKIIALLARGNLEQASSLNWEEVQTKREQAWQFLLSLLKKEETSRFLKSYGYSQRSVVREDLEQTLEIFSSFCRDFVLIKERGDRNLLLNPDFEEEIRRAEELLSLEQSLGCLVAVDAVLSGLSRNLNLSLLLSSFLSYFMEREYV